MNLKKLFSRKRKTQMEIIDAFAKRLKEINTFNIIVSDLSEVEMAYNMGFNAHHVIINEKIDELVNEFTHDFR